MSDIEEVDMPGMLPIANDVLQAVSSLEAIIMLINLNWYSA